MTAGRCTRCLQRVCLCSEVPTVVTRTRVVIVRHHLEQNRSSNSGRLAHLALPNSVIVDHGANDETGRSVPAVLPHLDGAWLVFPAGPPITVAPVPPPAQLVILDGTWQQARRMFKKLGALRGLPAFSLPDLPMPAARMRASPGPGQVSTIEAIARALRILEGDAVAAPLEALFDLAVERARSTGRSI